MAKIPQRASIRAVPDGLSPMRCSRGGNLPGPEESFDDLGPFSGTVHSRLGFCRQELRRALHPRPCGAFQLGASGAAFRLQQLDTTRGQEPRYRSRNVLVFQRSSDDGTGDFSRRPFGRVVVFRCPSEDGHCPKTPCPHTLRRLALSRGVRSTPRSPRLGQDLHPTHLPRRRQ